MKLDEERIVNISMADHSICMALLIHLRQHSLIGPDGVAEVRDLAVQIARASPGPATPEQRDALDAEIDRLCRQAEEAAMHRRAGAASAMRSMPSPVRPWSPMLPPEGTDRSPDP